MKVLMLFSALNRFVQSSKFSVMKPKDMLAALGFHRLEVLKLENRIFQSQIV